MTFKEKLIHPIAARFFAGTELQDAVLRAKAANGMGMGVTIDLMGEDLKERNVVERVRREYSRIIDTIQNEKLDASLAVKPTHIGLSVNRKIMEDNLLLLADYADKKGIFLWVDMEGSAWTGDTLKAYSKVRDNYENAGIALQACLHRTWDDLREMVASGAKVRLVKGAYSEPPSVAIQGGRKVRARFQEMMEYLFAEAPSFAIGTHDLQLIKRGLELAATSKCEPEFQMLMGMRDDVKRKLAEKSLRVVEYVPYGKSWYAYGVRRLREKNRNIIYIIQGLYNR
jgi:proline dehydrogenase